MDRIINSITTSDYYNFLNYNKKYNKYLDKQKLIKIFKDNKLKNNTYKIWQILFIVRWIEINDV